MLSLKEFGPERLEEIKKIYAAEGWNAYLRDDAKLNRAFAGSLLCLGAFDGDTLTGFVRCVGDGEHIVLIQDLIVDIPYRGHGTGKALLRAVAERYKTVRMLQVVTDAEDVPANNLYRSQGLKPLEQGGMLAYYR